jgi:hypothetical protein
MPLPNRTNRKFGVEMEGYVNSSPRNLYIRNANIKRDGSLRNSDWDSYHSDYGVEITTEPITNFSTLEQIFLEMQSKGWHVDENAGTHIHIDISDFSEFEKGKLLSFAKGIEKIIFMFVKEYRNGNEYCKKLQDEWRNIFKPREVTVRTRDSRGRLTYQKKYEEALDLEGLLKRRSSLLDVLWQNGFSNCSNNKYYWLNIYRSRYGTAEFRIFHAIENIDELKAFVWMAHNIVEIAKHSSVAQLEFIILSLYEATSIDALRQNFQSLLGIDDYTLAMPGNSAKRHMMEKVSENRLKQENIEKRLARLMLAQ